MVTFFVYTEYADQQDEIAKSQMLYEAQATILAKSNTFIYNHIEKDKISISETIFSE